MKEISFGKENQSQMWMDGRKLDTHAVAPIVKNIEIMDWRKGVISEKKGLIS